MLLVALAGCAFDRANTAQRAKQVMIGMAKDQILACMGAPDRHMAVGATEVWTYVASNGRTDTYGDGWSGKDGFGFGTSQSRTRFCKVDVSMQNGVVSAIHYGGPNGGLLTQGEQCAYAVKRCVSDGS